jgi:hypothetical protein
MSNNYSRGDVQEDTYSTCDWNKREQTWKQQSCCAIGNCSKDRKREMDTTFPLWRNGSRYINPLMLQLNPSAQRRLTNIFNGDFAFWTVHFFNLCVKNQQTQQLFIQLINYVWHPLQVSALVTWCARTTSLDTPRPSTIFCRLLLNWASLRRY